MKFMVYATQKTDFEMEVDANSADEATAIALSKPDDEWDFDGMQFTVDYVDELSPEGKPIEIALIDNSGDRKELVKDESTPVETLIRLIKENHQDVRHILAENPRLPLEILNELATDKSDAVRGAVARNVSTPEVLLAKLVRDE